MARFYLIFSILVLVSVSPVFAQYVRIIQACSQDRGPVLCPRPIGDTSTRRVREGTFSRFH